MKYDAMKHQGSKAGGLTLDEIGEAAGESGKTVQRYIWLSRLSDALLELIDNKKLGIMQEWIFLFLSEEAQQWVLVMIEELNVTVTTTQASKLKEYGKSGELTLAMVKLILSEEKPKERKFMMKSDKIGRYFSDSYSNEEIEKHHYFALINGKRKGCLIMGYLTSGNVIVDAMGSINISGNIIPSVWYRTITKENGKPYLLAIVILADIVYWYRPSEVRIREPGIFLDGKRNFQRTF